MTILIHNLESWREGIMGITMKKFTLVLLFLVAPGLALAAESVMSFAPPATDVSVVFLGNLFGIVDGVLHGSGSQIMGSMFAVFNAAVLALGGIIIMYTLIVSTLNTAHEGEMLGKKWSSLWVPMRATFGLALLIPKASGYCLMQIFIMWVVVQGVGAADKVWNAALSYLNRGGMIIHAQTNPIKNLNNAGPAAQLVTGAEVMLAGQVCMQGLQTQLEAVRQEYLAKKQSGGGPCYGDPLPTDMDQFCNFSIPSLSNSVNFLSVQQDQPLVQVNQAYTMKMPNFPYGSPYAFLNGACGKITWNRFGLGQNVLKQLPTLTDADVATANISRTVAVQQMYLDLGLVASTMISNDPQLGPPPQGNPPPMPLFSRIAKQPFGMPMTKDQTVCPDSATTDCVLWGIPSGSQGAPLLNGTEFQGAISDYNGIMLPSLILIQEAVQANSSGASRNFISAASSRGWLMAGSYFFNLVILNQEAAALSDQTDSTSGLEGSKFDAATILGPYSGSTSSGCQPTSDPDLHTLCNWLRFEISPSLPLQNIVDLITGQILGGNPPTGIPATKGTLTTKLGTVSSTVYGYIVNALVLQTGAQPGTAPLQFANKIRMDFSDQVFQLPALDFGCGVLKIGIPLIFFTITFATCFGGALADIAYNHFIRVIFNALLEAFAGLINGLVELFIVTPLIGMSAIFKYGLDVISAPGSNPIVALAQMGTFYLNFSGQLALDMVDQAIIGVILPVPFDMFVFVLLGAAMPVIMAFLGIFSSIGITTAYYIPMLPYMMFTFGGIAWLTSVIESMVAGPIVALGVTHPEGEGAFGKGEAAIMILLNVFLRPSLMIIGYIAGIAVCYISVWMINAGFDKAIGFVQGSDEFTSLFQNTTVTTSTAVGQVRGGYVDWAGVYAYFFSILIYVSIYLTVVQKSFSLIATLPDQVLRWIGGAAESSGKEASDWGKDTKGEIDKAGKSTQQGVTQSIAGTTEGAVAAAKFVKGGAMKLGSKLMAKGAKGKSSGGDATAKPEDGKDKTSDAASKAEDALDGLSRQQSKDDVTGNKTDMPAADKAKMDTEDKTFEDNLDKDTTLSDKEKHLARIEHYANQASSVSKMGFDNSDSLGKLDGALAALEAETAKPEPESAKPKEELSEKEQAASLAEDEAFEHSLLSQPELSKEDIALKRIAHYSGKAARGLSLGGGGGSSHAQEKLAGAIAELSAARESAAEVKKDKKVDDRTISDRAEDTLAGLASAEKKAGAAGSAAATPMSAEALELSRAEDKEFEAALKKEVDLSDSERELKRVDYYGAKLTRSMGEDGSGAVDPELEKILDKAITKFEEAVENEKEPSAITRAKANFAALGVDTGKAFKTKYKRTEDKAGTKEYKKSLKDDPKLSERERRVKGALFNAGLESRADKKDEDKAGAALGRLAAAKEKAATAAKEPGAAAAGSARPAQTKEESDAEDKNFEDSLDKKSWLTPVEKETKRIEFYADKAARNLGESGVVDAGAEKKLEKAMKGLEKAKEAEYEPSAITRAKSRFAAFGVKTDEAFKTKYKEKPDPKALANFKRKLDADPKLSEGEKRFRMATFDPKAEAKKLEKSASSALAGFDEAKTKVEAAKKQPVAAGAEDKVIKSPQDIAQSRAEDKAFEVGLAKATGLSPADKELKKIEYYGAKAERTELGLGKGGSAAVHAELKEKLAEAHKSFIIEDDKEDKKFEDGLKDKKWLTPKEKELVRMEYYAVKATRCLGAGGAVAERAEKKLDAVIKSYEGLVKDDKRYDDVLRRAKANFATLMGKGTDTSALDASFKSLKPAMTADQKKDRAKFMEGLDADPTLSDRQKTLKRILYDADIAEVNRIASQPKKKT